jgi:hypothetical protein
MTTNKEIIDYKLKYLKYKNKYNKLKLEILGSGAFFNKNTSNKKCEYQVSNQRVPSNCDRIIYKSKSPITLINYEVINDTDLVLIKLSDHKMIFANFILNNKKYLMFSWNMGAFDKKITERTELITKEINKFIQKYINLEDYDFIVFSFQESIKESVFIKDLITQLLEIKKSYNLIVNEVSNPNFISISSTKKYYVRLLVFSKNNLSIINKGYDNFKLYNESRFNQVKTLLGTKSFVWAKLNDVTIVSTHFPIDTTDNQTLGNNLRISAFNEIKQKFSDSDILIIGDLNFRKLNNGDQLSNLLDTDKTFKEIGTLKEPTCKYDNCKLACDKNLCTIVGK